MTLGYGSPRAKCPHCAEEGAHSVHQTQNAMRGPSRFPLVGTLRFECSQGHAWTTPTEDAELMGAFLDRQPT